MFFDRSVFLNVFPENYHTDIYDIANIFYKGAILRGPRICDVNPDATGANAGAGADYVAVSLFDKRWYIDVYFCVRGGRPDDGNNLIAEDENYPCARQNHIKAEAVFIDGYSKAYSIKLTLYRILKKRAFSERKRERPLPWGALVGVRPVKIYSDLLDRGATIPEIAGEMSRAYDVPAKTSELCLRIATAQKPILRAYDPDKDCMLYIGIPFCVSKCAYCSFPSDAHNKIDIYAPRYVDALLKELNYIAGYIRDAGRGVKAVYIGGGTPTALGARELDKLLGGVGEAFFDSCADEITVEAGRADTIDRDKLAIIRKAAKIADRLRLCVNPQTMNARTLSLIGRNHTPVDVLKAYWLAREEGFNEINMDIIAGLPGEDISDFNRTLDAISQLKPESLTSHTLCVKRSSRLYERGNDYEYPGAETAEAMQEAAYDLSIQMGMAPYYLYRQKNTIGGLANVGYAVKGRECIYNIHEMADRLDVFAAGAGAVSKFINAAAGSVERVFNVKNLLEYISRNDEMIERKKRYLTSKRKESSVNGKRIE